MAHALPSKPEPFASVVFTLSTHNPYQIPPQYAGVLPKGELPIHQTVAYFDQALEKFFETAATMPWYKTHAVRDHRRPYRAAITNTSPRMIDSYRVPIIFYHPGRQLPRGKTRPCGATCRHRPQHLGFLGHRGGPSCPSAIRFLIAPTTGWPSVKRQAIFGSRIRIIIWNIAKTRRAGYFVMAKLDTPITDRPEVQSAWKRSSKPRSSGLPTGSRKIVCISSPGQGISLTLPRPASCRGSGACRRNRRARAWPLLVCFSPICKL